jgi:hypothetical protein
MAVDSTSSPSSALRGIFLPSPISYKADGDGGAKLCHLEMRDTRVRCCFGGWGIRGKDNCKYRGCAIWGAIADSTEQARGILRSEDGMCVDFYDVGTMIFAAPVLDLSRGGVPLNVDDEGPGASGTEPKDKSKGGIIAPDLEGEGEGGQLSKGRRHGNEVNIRGHGSIGGLGG